jgi:hypothetical protein
MISNENVFYYGDLELIVLYDFHINFVVLSDSYEKKF